jgi:hypothetical protein
MNKSIPDFFFTALAVGILSCDSGDIYPQTENENIIKVNVTATFKLSNSDAFSDNYKLAVATFIGTSPYPDTYQVIEKPENDGDTVQVTLSELPKEVTTINLCLLQAVGNKSIYSFYSYPINETPTSDIRIPVQDIDLAPFGRVQAQVFSQCLQCHGGGSRASAGLYLIADSAFKHLVNHLSKNSVKYRVTPNSINNSFLLNVLTDKTAVAYNHTDISTLETEDVTLVELWIQSGAKH